MTPHLAHLLQEPPLWLAALLAAGVAGGAWALRWLTRGGALAAFCVGVIVFGLGGSHAAVPLLAFFGSSSLLSKLHRSRKAAADSAGEDVRHAGQVWANGGPAAALVLLHRLMAYRWPLDWLRNV